MTTNAVQTDVSTVSIFGKPTIFLGYHLIDFIAEKVTTTLPSSAYVLITDTHLAPLYLPAFEQAFKTAIGRLPDGQQPRWLSKTISPGEQSKNRETKAMLEDWLLSERCTRDTVIIALGGGVVGDLVGFVASTYMRGVKVIQVSTSLLGMVDSSIGGKVGFLLLVKFCSCCTPCNAHD